MLPSYEKYQNGGILDFKTVKSKAKEGIEKLGVKTSSENSAIKNLSGGNQQKAILARWVEKAPGLLFLDEPTRGIDVRAKGEIYDLVRQLADAGMTVVIVSSEIDEILAVADRVMVMFEGDVKGTVVPDGSMKREDILRIALS